MAGTPLTHIEQLVDQLSVDDQLDLLEHLGRRLRHTVPQRSPQNLYGIWRDRFPAEFNIDAVLAEIRCEWEDEVLQKTDG